MDAETLKKSVSQKAAALRKLDAALKDAAALANPLPPASAYVADEAVRCLETALRELEDVDATVVAMGVLRASLEARVSGAMADASARLTGQIAAALAKDAPVTGQLPELRWGLLRLEFKLTGLKREVVIWYGPKVAKLASSAADADAIVTAAREARSLLDRAPLDAAAFLDELGGAYESTRRRLAVAPHTAVPILAVLQDLVISRQSTAFLADPSREHFQPYPRVQFSYDLYRAGPRGALSLGVAAHAQTKKPEDHLWVPTSPSGDGTHFASLAVRERNNG